MITVKGLTKIFDDYKALEEVTCTIPEGCIYGMVGSNGAGKSTFLRLISGVYKADAGDIKVDDMEVYENPDVKKLIAFVPDDLYFLNNATMNRMADMYSRYYKDFDRERFDSLTETFQLNPKKSINTFSKGMKRQVAIILALSCKPKYLFLDETFDGLDPVMRALVKSIICSDVQERKATAILTSHSLRELEDTCDQLALLHKGGLVFESDIENMKTSLFKVQTAFADDYDQSRFEDLQMLHFSKSGSVCNIIVKGNKEEVADYIKGKNPILLDILPLSLEEVFTYEMEALGYAFDIELLGKEEQQYE